MNAFIYHITSQEAWGQAYLDGIYKDESLESEGFIHCCRKEQLPYVSNNYFRGQEDLVVLEIDLKNLDSEIREEGRADLKFPHVYGPIPAAAVRKVYVLFWDRKLKKFDKPGGL